MLNYVKGDLLLSCCDYICHQVNCQGTMNAGLAKKIRTAHPGVFRSYKKLCSSHGKVALLGQIDIAETHCHYKVISIFGQMFYGKGDRRYTSYDAFEKALIQITKKVNYGASIAFPKGIGCGLGGGNWNIIAAIIDEILAPYYDIYIYELEENE